MRAGQRAPTAIPPTGGAIASVNYYRKSDLPGVETIEAFVDGIISQKIDHYWIADTPYGETVDNLKVLYYDEEDNTLVIGCPPGSGPFSRVVRRVGG